MGPALALYDMLVDITAMLRRNGFEDLTRPAHAYFIIDGVSARGGGGQGGRSDALLPRGIGTFLKPPPSP